MRLVTLTGFERQFFRAGLTIEVRVTRPGHVGKLTRFRIQQGGAPLRTDMCLPPAAKAPTPCTAG